MATAGRYSLISEDCKIGKYTAIGNYVSIGKNVIIGNNCKIGSYCEIRDGCILGDNISMGSRCTLSSNTIVEDDVIMKYSFVVTDTPDLNSNKRLCSVLRKGSKFGANVTIMPGVEIGEGAIVGACSQVRHSIPKGEVWYGNPAKRK
jgi:UDP-2-acetamido-3-amino-2,3-dideoxy-glucuronate N-acetyltransferase